ncbi:hypothetical protein LUZ60_013882 [Juncus effusus]|nr:hypothetical protein LUZ60_013882 [Juncus effusus]
MEASSKYSLLLLFFFTTVLLPSALSQGAVNPPAPAPAPESGCNGILLSYDLWGAPTKIRPFLKDPTNQAYKFQSRASVLNSGTTVLKAWALLIKFQYKEIIVTMKGGFLTNGADLPYNTTVDVNATSISGDPNADLLTPIATANDQSLIEADIDLVGTLFGGPKTLNPFPVSISLADPSYICPPLPKPGNYTFSMSTCCVPNPIFNPNNTVISNITDPKKDYKPNPAGDLIITYDVLQAYPSSYLASVSIENKAPLGRLDNWHLTWTWKKDEFIYSIKGAYPLKVDATGCIYGPQATYYSNLDFSKVLNCERNPILLDLPLSHYNNSELGRIPHCCRNGTILPKAMDPSQSISAFQVQVFKMPPDLNITKITPPQNWKITGGSSLNPDYTCGPPIRVSPTQFPDPSGLESNSTAFATWQVSCNITAKANKPKCCVTFSGFYNESVIPCNTCACGCPANRAGSTCSTTQPALLLPSEALLVPFENRTAKTLAWASLKHFNVPNPLPCGDYCGMSMNWHIATDYNKGWTARITLFNWGQSDFANWFAAVEMDKAYLGFEKMYSFNGTSVGNNTIFMQGLEGLNYLVKMSNGTVGGPMVPGKQQTVVSFTKKLTPGIDVIGGGGFPSKVFFNGEECDLPTRFPVSGGFRRGFGGVWTVLGFVVVLVLNLN